ncbi:lipopolysaccharide transport periplasmic protein LptA [bacterium]|nr:lipopolysaccharide transport periplasmic protein LptA [bacterium]
MTPLLAQGTNLTFGTITQDTTAPVEVTSDELSVDQETGRAVFVGNVIVGQGELRLAAQKVTVIYREESAGIERMIATGNVTLVSSLDAAEAERADYTIDSGEIIMTGNVLLTQGLSAIASDKMVIYLKDGTANMTGRVKTILQTGNN